MSKILARQTMQRLANVFRVLTTNRLLDTNITILGFDIQKALKSFIAKDFILSRDNLRIRFLRLSFCF